MGRKEEENKDCEKSMVELKTKIGSNHRELHTLKHTLEQKQFAEWQSVLGPWDSPGSLTLSMVLFNKVEQRLKNNQGIPDYCRGKAWLLMQRSALLQLEQNKANEHLYYVCSTIAYSIYLSLSLSLSLSLANRAFFTVYRNY
jgi:hypothetical protein